MKWLMVEFGIERVQPVPNWGRPVRTTPTLYPNRPGTVHKTTLESESSGGGREPARTSQEQRFEPPIFPKDRGRERRGSIEPLNWPVH